MDESCFEQAQRLAEIQVESAIANAKRAMSISANGTCHNCGEKLPAFSGLRWCDEHCRDDWQKRKGVR